MGILYGQKRPFDALIEPWATPRAHLIFLFVFLKRRKNLASTVDLPNLAQNVNGCRIGEMIKDIFYHFQNRNMDTDYSDYVSMLIDWRESPEHGLIFNNCPQNPQQSVFLATDWQT